MKARKMATLSLAVTLALAGALTLLWRLDAASHIAHANPDIRWAANNCTGFPQSPCYTSIQSAVNAAGEGDVIRVTQGVYSETVVVTKSVTLEGGWHKGAVGRDWNIYTTTIDAHRAGSVIHVQEPYGKSLSSTIEGFILTGGDASAYLGWGGGILIDGNWEGSGMAIIRHNVITGNVACNGSVSCQGYGGGIMVYSSRSVIEYNTVISNLANVDGHLGGQGGGIAVWGYPGDSTVAHNVIVSNTALLSQTAEYGDGQGGGVWSEHDVVLIDNEIRGNVAAVKGEGRGGGVYAGGDLYENRILSNTASISGPGYGGGVYAHYAPDFNDNVAQGNVASKNGDGDGTGGGVYAIYLRDAHRNTIVDNAATRGGGVYFKAYTGQQTFSDNLVARNWATGLDIGAWDGGGGIASQADWVEITGNDILSNTALMGGGVLVTGGDRYLAQDNLIQGNWAFAGGGLYVYTATGAIVQNQVASNVAIWWGGGMYLFGKASPTMDRNVVVSNTAGGLAGFGGGGLILNVDADTRVTLTNHIIARNTVLTATAGGVHCLSGSCALIHCTIADNKLGSAPGEGVRLSAGGGTNVLWNSIVVGHSTGVTVPLGVATMDYNDYFDNAISVSGAAFGAHSRTDDPQFEDRAAGDYHLAETSPLINIGDGSVSAPHDFEGDPRPIGSKPDMGADEYVRARVYLPVVLRNFEDLPR